ncbi:MAG: MFS transporter [Chloroflexota bacterium]
MPPRLTETIAPERLGRGFRWLLGATFVNNLGDGVVLAAGPLLVVSLTRDPFLVSLAVLAESLPVLLFGVFGGAVADRTDRKRMVVIADVGRAIVLVVLVATIVSGSVSILIVLAALFLLGTCETFADSASSTLVPGLVGRDDLGIANARTQGGFLLMNQLVGPPIGAFLFTIGNALPFATDAACFALGAVLISRIVLTVPTRTGAATTLREDLVEGFRWLLHHPPMRTLAITIFLFNVTFGAAWGVLVLYAADRLGMGAVGYGLLTTAVAIGGIIGTVSYGALERRFALADIMRVGLLIETLWHLVFAVTTSAAIALGAMVVFGIHGFVWGTTSTVVRQRAVPNDLLGRVGGVYRVAIVGGMVVGTPIGGLLARQFGITAPFWFGFIGSAALVTLLWRQFDHIVHAGDEASVALPAT